ncbi:MAG: ABC transporter substrate-binding protein [Caldicoprobacterales bacterium]
MKSLLKTLSLAICVLLLLSTLAACTTPQEDTATDPTNAPDPTEQVSKETEPPPEPVEEQTVIWTCIQDQTGTAHQIAEVFEDQNPGIKIEIQEIPGNSDDVKKGLITSLAAQQPDPDVFNMDVIWTTQFASAGWLMDLTDVIDQDQYLDGPLTTVTYENKLWAFPMYTDVQLFYYRTDLVSTPPTTWDEMVEISKEHIGKNGIEYGLLFQAFQGEPIVCNGLSFIKSNGGNDIVNGEPVINSPNSVEALQFMRKLIDENISPEDVLAHKPVDSVAIYEQGKALFLIAWPSSYNQMNTSETSTIKDKFSVTLFPVGPSGTEPGPTVGGWNLAVNNLTDVPDAAVKFAQFACGAEGQKIRTLGTATLPAWKTVYDDPDVLEQLPIFSEVMASVDYAKSRPSAPDYPAMSTLIAVNLHKALSGTMSYEDALATLEEGMADLIN